MKPKLSVAMVGAGKLANFLAPALAGAGYRVTEILTRRGPASIKRARSLARRVGARVSTLEQARLDAELIWLAVPDGEIQGVAHSLANLQGAFSPGARSSTRQRPRFAFHSSGALPSAELSALRSHGVAIASVHPLMTFVAHSQPSLAGVPFALEGDTAAIKAARPMVRDLGGHSFVLDARRKAAYHAWATMTSPLLLAYLVTLEEAARQAGLSRIDAGRMSLPIVRQTLENYARLGPANSFSGPFIRGDSETIKKHMALLRHNSKVRKVYLALARAALDGLPVKNRGQLRRLLDPAMRER